MAGERDHSRPERRRAGRMLDGEKALARRIVGGNLRESMQELRRSSLLLGHAREELLDSLEECARLPDVSPHHAVHQRELASGREALVEELADLAPARGTV